MMADVTKMLSATIFKPAFMIDDTGVRIDETTGDYRSSDIAELLMSEQVTTAAIELYAR
jgi:hypothetical protein